jgi:hypothetical protein
MTRKDYQLIAKVLKYQSEVGMKDNRKEEVIRYIAEHLAIELKKDNERFNADTFFLASGLLSGSSVTA